MLNFIYSLKPDFTIILGDFNARSKSWWKDDINKIEGTKIDALTSYHGLHQLISQPTHILENSASCIDLIFTDQLLNVVKARFLKLCTESQHLF